MLTVQTNGKQYVKVPVYPYCRSKDNVVGLDQPVYIWHRFAWNLIIKLFKLIV